MSTTPAGWYPQSDGRQRYWDGSQWTEHFAPGEAQQAATGATSVAAATPAAARPWFKKKRFVIPGAVVGVILLGNAVSGGDSPNTSVALASSSPTTEVVAADTAASAAPSPAATKPAAKPAAKPAPAGPKIGSKVRDGKFEFVVTGVKCGIKTVGNEYFNTKAQGEFCRVSMKISNIGDKAQSMFADNQLAFDAKKRQFSASSEASIYDDKSQVLFEEINPGNTVNGRVYFDVPKGAKLVKMELHDSMFSGGVEVALKK